MCKSQMHLNWHFLQLSNVSSTSNWKLLANCKTVDVSSTLILISSADIKRISQNETFLKLTLTKKRISFGVKKKHKTNRNSVTGKFSLSARRWRSNIWEADEYIEYFFTWQSNVYLIKRILLIHLNFDSIYYIELYNSSGYKLHNIHVHYIITTRL